MFTKELFIDFKRKQWYNYEDGVLLFYLVPCDRMETFMLSLFLLLAEEDRDKQKFEYIYRNYANLMYAVALKYSEDEKVAEELVSEVFFSILDNIKIIRTDSELSLKAYVLCILKNKYYDLLKEEKNHPLSLEEIDEIADESDFESDVILDEQKKAIIKIILKMPKTYRYVFHFRYNEEYSVKDIAKMFNIGEATVRKILKEGVRNIINSLREGEENEI